MAHACSYNLTAHAMMISNHFSHLTIESNEADNSIPPSERLKATASHEGDDQLRNIMQAQQWQDSITTACRTSSHEASATLSESPSSTEPCEGWVTTQRRRRKLPSTESLFNALAATPAEIQLEVCQWLDPKTIVMLKRGKSPVGAVLRENHKTLHKKVRERFALIGRMQLGETEAERRFFPGADFMTPMSDRDQLLCAVDRADVDAKALADFLMELLWRADRDPATLQKTLDFATVLIKLVVSSESHDHSAVFRLAKQLPQQPRDNLVDRLREMARAIQLNSVLGSGRPFRSLYTELPLTGSQMDELEGSGLLAYVILPESLALVGKWYLDLHDDHESLLWDVGRRRVAMRQTVHQNLKISYVAGVPRVRMPRAGFGLRLDGTPEEGNIRLTINEECAVGGSQHNVIKLFNAAGFGEAFDERAYDEKVGTDRTWMTEGRIPPRAPSRRCPVPALKAPYKVGMARYFDVHKALAAVTGQNVPVLSWLKAGDGRPSSVSLAQIMQAEEMDKLAESAAKAV